MELRWEQDPDGSYVLAHESWLLMVWPEDGNWNWQAQRGAIDMDQGSEESLEEAKNAAAYVMIRNIG